MTQKRVVLRDVAEKAGVHLTTAARAMKNDPRVQKETQELIHRVAKELGYVPDPMLSALSTYRTAIRPSPYHGTVVWLTNFATRAGWQCESFNFYREGAKEALARHGYHLEDFWLQEPGMSLRRAAQIIESRGIRGILVCPLPTSDFHLEFPWDRFAAVAFGHTLVKPALHFVTASHYQNMQICLREVHRRGYRRPGLVTWDEISKRVAESWTAAYRTPPFEGDWDAFIPILKLEQRPTIFSDANREIFLAWMRRHRPDVVLVVDQHILEWLREAGTRVPEEVAYVSPSLQKSNTGIHAGVLEPSLEIGSTAGEFLVGMLNRGEYGVPKIPRRILLDGAWQQGPTVGTPAAVAV